MIKSLNFIFKSVIHHICNIINSLQTPAITITASLMNFSVTERKKKIYFADVEAATDNWMFLIQIEIICPHIKYWCSLYDDKCGSRHTNQPKNASLQGDTQRNTEETCIPLEIRKRSLIVFCRTLDIPTMCILLWK